MWRSSFLVNLQPCRLIVGNFTIKWTLPQLFFDSISSPPPHALPMFWLKSPLPSIKFWKAPPNVLKTCGKPCLTLIFSQPLEVVKKYFSHNPHWWSCVGWQKRSHSIHWQDWMLQFFTMVCLMFYTVNIINRKNWRIITQLHFENLSIFLKKANVRTC